MALIKNSSVIIKTVLPALTFSVYRYNHTKTFTELQNLISSSIAKTEILQYNLDKTDKNYNIILHVQNHLKTCLYHTGEITKNVNTKTKYKTVDRFD